MEQQEITLLELFIKIIRFLKRHSQGYVIAFVSAIILSVGYYIFQPKSYINNFRIYSSILPKHYIVDNLLISGIIDNHSLNFDSSRTFLDMTFISSDSVNQDSLIGIFENKLNNDPFIQQFFNKDYAETQLLVNKIEHLYNLNDSLYKLSLKTTSSSALYNFPSWISISILKTYSQKYYKLKHYKELSKISIIHIPSNQSINNFNFIKIIILSIILVLFFATILFIIIDINHLIIRSR